ncbi:zinc finger and SCAN domain-containing protein 23-like [Aedes aegypti]|uniref:C2H2-type domain-containing protein n=1 Tax=Aedes aegypti TaxID=7159 RepID=A0A6I8U356_AEDAE|nr:zinc finger and SCAN domain-containing protein 23-like [Aedes aegypti]
MRVGDKPPIEPSPGGSNQEIDNDANTKQPSKGEISNDTSSANLEKDDKNASVDSNDGSIEEDCQIIKAEFEPSSQEPDEIEALEDEHHSDDDPVMIDDCENENLSESAFDLNKLEDQQPQSMEEDEEEEYIVHPSGVIYSSDQSSDLVTVDHQAMSDIISDGESSDMRELVEVSASVSGDNAAHATEYVLHLCDQCDRSFGNTQTLKAHMAAHERNYKCSFCGKLCPTAVSLAGHENTHTKDQPFQCSQCGRNFAQYTSMRRHMKIHFNEKAYQCDFCAKRFRQRTVMLTHRRIHTGEKPFSCGTCNKTFRDHSTLAKHKRIHEKKPPANKN